MVSNTCVPTTCKYPDILGKKETKLRTLNLGTDPEPSVETKVIVMVLKNAEERGWQVREAILKQKTEKSCKTGGRGNEQGLNTTSEAVRDRLALTSPPSSPLTHRLQTPSDYKVIHPNCLRLWFAAVYGR